MEEKKVSNTVKRKITAGTPSGQVRRIQKPITESEKECHCHDKEEKGECCSLNKEIKNESCLHKKEETATSCCGHEERHESGDCHDEDGCGCGKETDFDDKKERRKGIIFLVVSVISLILSYINPLHDISKVFWILDFAWVAIILCGLPIYKSAIKAVMKKKITSALLISIAMTASIIMGILTVFGIDEGHHESYFFVAGEVSFLMALGGMIESLTVSKSRSIVKSLIAIKPSTAYVKRDNSYIETNVKDIEVCDIVLIKPNETVAVDGVVLSGYGAINEANITGESKPSDKKEGDKVFAGTSNLNSALEVKVTKKSNETTLSKLIDYVKNAEKNKAPIVRLADKWASYLVPAACLISAVVFFIALFAIKVSPLEAINRAITILVVICPCALALATPIAVSAGIGNAGKKGILIKSGIALEALAKVDTIAFDKTGTLTSGELKVTKVHTKNLDQNTVLYYASSAEMYSEHPIARAIIASYNGNMSMPKNTKSIGGVGLTATVDGKEVELIKLSQVKEDYSSWYKHDAASTVTAVLLDGVLEGIIEISDTIRDDSPSAINQLNSMGLNTVMLTGDNNDAALSVKEQLGLKNFYSNLLPEDKVKKVQELKDDGKTVLMVGDGVNDAPALALSDCSVSMGAMGNSIAIETADISLMDSKISKIPLLIGLAKRTLLTIKINITASISINIAAVVLSAFGLLGVVGGAFVHNLGSVFVSLNAALILLYKGKKSK